MIMTALCVLLLAVGVIEGPTREHPKIYGTNYPASLMGGFNESIIDGTFNTVPTIDQSLPFDDSYESSSQDAKEENSNAGPPLSICFVSLAAGPTIDHEPELIFDSSLFPRGGHYARDENGAYHSLGQDGTPCLARAKTEDNR